ncbi:hypothetical protein MKW92_043190, partial [Papaver armeniacum]
TYVGEDDDDSEDEESEDFNDSEDEDSKDDNDSEEDEQEDDDDDSDEEEQEEEDIETKRERLPGWGSSRAVNLDRLNSGTHVGVVERGNSKIEDLEDDDDDSEEEDTGTGLPISLNSGNEAKDIGHLNSCELLDSYGRYLQESINLKRRKLDLETRKFDFEIRVEESRHMSMDTTKMNALQLKWWQMRANQIEEKHRISHMSIGDVDDDKDEDRNDVEQEEGMENRKKKTKMM